MYIMMSCIIGVVVGILANSIVVKNHRIGNLRIDNSDTNDNPYIFLEMDSSTGGTKLISKKKYIVLNVVVKDYISHE